MYLCVPSVFLSASMFQIKERVVQAASNSNARGASISCSQALVSTMSHHSTSSSTVSSSPSSKLFPLIESKRSNNSWFFDNFDNYQLQLCNITAVPLSSQENLLLYDLIYCLTGIRGSYVTPKVVESQGDHRSQFPTMEFTISDQVHSSLRDIAQEILPLAGYYACIQQFIHKASFTNCSQVLQALSGALNSLIHDYYVCLTQSFKSSSACSNELSFSLVHFSYCWLSWSRSWTPAI